MESPSALERRRSLLYAALGFCQLENSPAMPEVTALKQWLGTWNGLGHIVVGMERQGYDLELVKIDGQGWRAAFYPTGIWHSLTSDSGTAKAPTPFTAVQQAAWRALNPRRPPTPGTEENTESVL